MATITTTTSLSFDAAASLTVGVDKNFEGSIAFTSANDDVWPSFTVTKPQNKTYGPFGIAMTVVITVGNGSLDYTINGGNGGFGYDTDGNVVSLVSGDGNLLAGRLGFETLLSRYGAVFNGSTDDSAAIQNALDAYVVEGSYKRAIFPCGGLTAKINAGLTIDANTLSVDFGGLIIDASGMSSGYALSLTGQSILPYNVGSNINAIENLKLMGVDTDGGAVDGILVGVDSLVPGHATIKNVLSFGFRDNLVIGSNVYVLQFQNFHSKDAHRYGLNYTGSTNSGESISFFGGGFLDCLNAGETAIGVYVPSSAAGPDLFFFGTSFSYNDVAFDINCGASSFSACHFESRTNNPMGKVSYTGGRPSTNVALVGGSVSHGTLGSGTENTYGRPIMFSVNSSTGDRLGFSLRGVRYGGYGKKETELVNFTGAAFVQIHIKECTIDQQGANMGKISNFTSMLANGGFETNATSGWTTSAGGATITQDASVYNTDAAGTGGTKALKIVASAQSSTYYQDIRVQPGELFILRAFTNMSAFTSGSATIKAYFYANDAATLLSTQTLGTISAAQAGWTLFSSAYRCVAGSAFVRVELATASLTGTLYFDDVAAWVQ